MCVVFSVCNRVKVVPVDFRLPHYTYCTRIRQSNYVMEVLSESISERNVFGLGYGTTSLPTPLRESSPGKYLHILFKVVVKFCFFSSFVNAIFSRVSLSLGGEL